MINSELYKQLEDKFSIYKMIQVSEIVAEMYFLIYKDNPDDCKECLFEGDWWKKKHEELTILYPWIK
jgi:hypothetical protein